jgi:hypothetical protein
VDGMTKPNIFSRIRRRFGDTFDAGMTTAEYAVGTIAAVGFAAVLYKIVRSPAVSSMLTSIIETALHGI